MRLNSSACNNCRAAMLLMMIVAPAIAAARPPTLDPTYGMRPTPIRHRAQPPVGAGAQWIWTADTRNTQVIGARREFDLSAEPKRASLIVTADNYFTAFINGVKLGGTGPGDGDFAWRDAHHYEIAGHLRAGRNVLAIEARNTGGPGGVVAALRFSTAPARQESTARARQEIITNGGWRVMDTPPTGWETPSFDASGWAHASVEAPLGAGDWGPINGWPGLTAAADYLRELPVRPTGVLQVSPGRGAITGERTLVLSSANLVVTPAPAGTPEADCPSLMVDFGREITGRVRIASAASAPAQISLRTGESQDEANDKPYTGDQKLELPAGGDVQGGDSAYRYAKITFLAGPRPIRIRAIHCQHIYYPVEYRGSFDCSDPLLTRIWYTGAYTCHLCMQSDIWDAPKRDRARWMGDLQVSGEVINDAFLDRFLMEQTMDRLRADAGTPPHRHVNGIPGYSCAWVVGMADFYRHTGDLAYIRKHHADLIALLDYFRGELDDRGLFADRRGEWTYVDWSPNFNAVDPHALKATHFYMVLMLKDGAWLLREMGDSAAAARYEAWALSATDAAQKYLRDPGTNTFGDRWQENAMAIYSGVATPDERRAIWQRVLSVPYPERLMITPYYNNYCINAISLAGHTPAALRFVRDYWGGMIREGATTFWEGYDTRWPKAHFHRYLQADNGMGYFVSLSHGWSAGAASWLTEQVLGVRSVAAGMTRLEIAPSLSDLAWAKGTVPTPRGPARVSFRRVGGALHAQISLPPGTTAQVTLPGAPPRTLGPGEHRL